MGGNDVALQPLTCTVINMAILNLLTPQVCLDNACGCALPCDDPLYGFSTGCLSNFCAIPCGYGYILHLFGTRIKTYVDRLTSKTRPKTIGVCMIYYPDEAESKGWADRPLSLLGYNSNPKRLQGIIDKIFKDATSNISLQNTTVVPIELSKVLNGKDTRDYVERVEPSEAGGKKMAEYIWQQILSASIYN